MWSGKGGKTRTYSRVCGVGRDGEWVVFNNSGVNLHKAIAERIFRVKVAGEFVKPPRPISDAFARLEPEKDYLLRFLPRRPRLTRQQFVGLYSGPKRKLYEKAVSELDYRSVQRSDSDVKAFIKKEKQQVKSGHVRLGNAELPVPRIIQPRKPTYNVELGRYTRAIEEDVYECLASMYTQRHVVLKGLNAYEQAEVVLEEWNKYNNPVAVGLDASRFDQHCSTEALQFEHSIYNGVFKSAELRRLLEWQLDYKLTAISSQRDRFTCRVKGCRASGDMNTGLGNCLLMCCMVKAYLRKRNVVASLLNNGDDCVVIMDSSDLQRFKSNLDLWFTEMGYTMKVEDTVHVVERIEFCQCHPVWNGERWTMIRNLSASLEKDTISITERKGRDFKKWMGSVGDCGLAIANGVPVLQEFYGAFQRNGLFRYRMHDEYSGLMYLSKGLVAKHRSVTPEARLSFWRAFGVSVELQLALERLYSSMHLDDGPARFYYHHYLFG